MYNVFEQNKDKEVSWEEGFDSKGGFPTLAEIVEVARKEFPGVPLEKLMITAFGNDDGACIYCSLKK